MSRYRVRVQLIEWYEVALDEGSLKQAIAEAEHLPPPVIRKRGKYLSTTTGLADSVSVMPIATSLPRGTIAGPANPHAPGIHDSSDPFPEVLHPKGPSSHMPQAKPYPLVNQPSECRQFAFIEPKAPAQESSTALLSPGPSATHNWAQSDGRRLELQPGKRLIHWRCTSCRRNCVHDLTTKEWYAVFPRVLDFERLDEVSQRWLAEECSGQYQAADERARKTQVKRNDA
jgi:hypothetical protein